MTCVMSGALAELRVIDCSRLIAGGVLATVLADHGADVIKVESPRGGDPLRTWLSERGELWWKVYARGKRSITLNLAQPRGQQLLKRLVRDADVVIENFLPGTFERWGLGWDVLSAENPRLVFARVSGWGQDGPYRDRPGFGTMVEAMSGFAHTTGEPDGPPPLLSLLGPDAAGYALDKTVRQRRGNTSDNASPRGTYRTIDDKWVALSASTPASATAVFTALGLGDLLSDPRFATNDARVEYSELVDATLAQAIGQRTLEEMRQLFESCDLTACPVYDIADITRDPHVVARGILIDVPDSALGAVRMTAPAPRLSDTPAAVRSTGPDLGAHNREVYGALGVSEAELAELQRDGIV